MARPAVAPVPGRPADRQGGVRQGAVTGYRIQEGGISAIQLCESCRDGRGYGPAIYWAGLLGQFSYWVALACLVQQQPH